MKTKNEQGQSLSGVEKTKDELKNEEIARETWDNWVGNLEKKEQPEACSIDNEDCEACGS